MIGNDMSRAQNSIFNEESTKFYYLEYQLDSSKSIEEIKKSLHLVLESQFDGVQLVVSFGNKAWTRLQPNWKPKDLCDFENLNGVKGYSMPSTQQDVFFWVHSQNHDDNFDQVLAIQTVMEKVAELKLDLAGFSYHNNKDLIGFEDGTANPKEDDRMLAALIPNGEVGAGGSYVLSQKWLHDLKSFKALSDEEQGKVVGRRKSDNEELEGDEMPNNSHISRTDLKINGQAMKIYRRSDPFGNATEHGLYFLAFACELKRLSSQLESMLGMTEDGIHDKLIEFSKATTSSYWFAPSAEDLALAIYS
jgi:putative iron-dependent peroxidase